MLPQPGTASSSRSSTRLLPHQEPQEARLIHIELTQALLQGRTDHTHLIERWKKLDLPIAVKFQRCDLSAIIRWNSNNPSFPVSLTTTLSILSRYGINLLRPQEDRPSLWRLIKFSNKVYKEKVACTRGAKEVLKLLGYAVETSEGIFYPEDYEPNREMVAIVTAELILAHAELRDFQKKTHPYSNRITDCASYQTMSPGIILGNSLFELKGETSVVSATSLDNLVLPPINNSEKQTGLGDLPAEHARKLPDKVDPEDSLEVPTLLPGPGYHELVPQVSLSGPGYHEPAPQVSLSGQGYPEPAPQVSLSGQGYHELAPRVSLSSQEYQESGVLAHHVPLAQVHSGYAAPASHRGTTLPPEEKYHEASNMSVKNPTASQGPIYSGYPVEVEPRVQPVSPEQMYHGDTAKVPSKVPPISTEQINHVETAKVPSTVLPVSPEQMYHGILTAGVPPRVPFVSPEQMFHGDRTGVPPMIPSVNPNQMCHVGKTGIPSKVPLVSPEQTYHANTAGVPFRTPPVSPEQMHVGNKTAGLPLKIPPVSLGQMPPGDKSAAVPLKVPPVSPEQMYHGVSPAGVLSRVQPVSPQMMYHGDVGVPYTAPASPEFVYHGASRIPAASIGQMYREGQTMVPPNPLAAASFPCVVCKGPATVLCVSCGYVAVCQGCFSILHSNNPGQQHQLLVLPVSQHAPATLGQRPDASNLTTVPSPQVCLQVPHQHGPGITSTHTSHTPCLPHLSILTASGGSGALPTPQASLQHGSAMAAEEMSQSSQSVSDETDFTSQFGMLGQELTAIEKEIGNIIVRDVDFLSSKNYQLLNWRKTEILRLLDLIKLKLMKKLQMTNENRGVSQYVDINIPQVKHSNWQVESEILASASRENSVSPKGPKTVMPYTYESSAKSIPVNKDSFLQHQAAYPIMPPVSKTSLAEPPVIGQSTLDSSKQVQLAVLRPAANASPSVLGEKGMGKEKGALSSQNEFSNSGDMQLQVLQQSDMTCVNISKSATPSNQGSNSESSLQSKNSSSSLIIGVDLKANAAFEEDLETQEWTCRFCKFSNDKRSPICLKCNDGTYANSVGFLDTAKVSNIGNASSVGEETGIKDEADVTWNEETQPEDSPEGEGEATSAARGDDMQDVSTWFCKHCTYSNPWTTLQCEMCDNLNDTIAEVTNEVLGIECSHCTFRNPIDVDICIMCYMKIKRPTRAVSEPNPIPEQTSTQRQHSSPAGGARVYRGSVERDEKKPSSIEHDVPEVDEDLDKLVKDKSVNESKELKSYQSLEELRYGDQEVKSLSQSQQAVPASQLQRRTETPATLPRPASKRRSKLSPTPEEEKGRDRFESELESLVDRKKAEDLAQQGRELIQLIRDTEKNDFSREEFEVAMETCGSDEDPLQWLQTTWLNLVQNVITKVAENSSESGERLGKISQSEAQQALIMSDGCLDEAVRECVNMRQEKVDEVMSYGDFDLEAVSAALSDCEGEVTAATQQLVQKYSQSFLSNIWAGQSEGSDSSLDGPDWIERYNEFVDQTFIQSITNRNLPADRRTRMALVEGQLQGWYRAEVVVHLVDDIGTSDEIGLEDIFEAVRIRGHMESARQHLNVECQLCMTGFPLNKIQSLSFCDCRICGDCLKDVFELWIRERNVKDLSCPVCRLPDVEDRTVAEQYFDFLNLKLKKFVDPDVHQLFQQKLRDWSLQTDPNFLWCAHCDNGFIIQEHEERKVECPKCKKHMCCVCKQGWEDAHKNVTCEEYKVYKQVNAIPDTNSITQQLYQNSIKCPACKVQFSLARGGCMHFKCTACEHEFCSGCLKPFKRGQNCQLLPNCASRGLHCHHPRDCFFYLRDMEICKLQNLLKEHAVEFNMDPPGQAGKKCPVMEQKEVKSQGRVRLVDEACGKEVPPKNAGFCSDHYKEYLVVTINHHKLDPVTLMGSDGLKAVFSRVGRESPSKKIMESMSHYTARLRQIIKDEIPLHEPELE